MLSATLKEISMIYVNFAKIWVIRNFAKFAKSLLKTSQFKNFAKEIGNYFSPDYKFSNDIEVV